MLAFGGQDPKNWRVTSGGAGYHALPTLTWEARGKGVRFVVVSPIADDAPDWLEAVRIVPRLYTDTAIIAALAFETIRRSHADRVFLDRYTVRIDALQAYLDGSADGVVKSLEWAARIAIVPLAELNRLAEQVTSAISAARVIEMLERPGSANPFDGGTVTLPNARLV